MNHELDRLAAELGLMSEGNEHMRFAFGYACAARIEHLLEDPGVAQCLRILGEYVRGSFDGEVFRHAQKEADRLANSHRGSKSIDGCGHAAVSASYAVANAINGKPLQAASYSAYATVYAEGGYGAVAQREAFDPEFMWQLNALREYRKCSQEDGSGDSSSVGLRM